jgi:hypothetical protein
VDMVINSTESHKERNYFLFIQLSFFLIILRKIFYFCTSISLTSPSTLANSLIFNVESGPWILDLMGHIITSFCFHGYLYLWLVILLFCL